MGGSSFLIVKGGSIWSGGPTPHSSWGPLTLEWNNGIVSMDRSGLAVKKGEFCVCIWYIYEDPLQHIQQWWTWQSFINRPYFCIETSSKCTVINQPIKFREFACEVGGEVSVVESEIFILKEYNGNSDVVPEHAHHILVRGVWLKAGKKRTSRRTWGIVSIWESRPWSTPYAVPPMCQIVSQLTQYKTT